MDAETRRLLKRITIWFAVAYPFLVLVVFGINSGVRAQFGGGEMPQDQVLGCIYGPAITIASCLLIWFGVYGIYCVVVSLRK